MSEQISLSPPRFALYECEHPEISYKTVVLASDYEKLLAENQSLEVRVDKLQEYLNLGGWPLLELEGKKIHCDADPDDIHDIYGGAIRQPDGRIFCELHSNRILISSLLTETTEAH
jgi:hypothetical protein